MSGVEYGQMEFDAFYREHRDGLVRLCYLTTLDVEVAADATQEAMLRAFTRWSTLEEQMPLAWVRKVALNLCRSRWRRAQRELRLLPRLYTVSAPEQPLRHVDLVKALQSLPQRQREAVALRYWGDLSVEQCAAAMGVSAGAVNQHLNRARSALRKGGVPEPEEEMA
ncbi:MAG: SigE family RNA polymerase sigma factor [Acidobacteriota bacterium]|nr:SigE family RNA polymerase sigma factor [Acidobacteriota bacterium]